MSLKFVNLHGHDGWSPFDGLGAPEDNAKQCLENAGEDSMAFAITNHGTMNSIGYAVAAAKKYKPKGLKIIHGLEGYYLPSLKDWSQLKKEKEETPEEQEATIEDEKETRAADYWSDPINRRNHIVLNATSNKGLENLFQIVSKSHKYGFYRKPRIDLAMLREHNEGLIVSNACVSGYAGFVSRQFKDAPIDVVMKEYDKEVLPIIEIFGRDRAFLELQFNKMEAQKVLNGHLVEYSKRTGYKLIATCDNHYPTKELWRAREIYKLLGYQQKGKEIDRTILEKTIDELHAELWLKNGDQMFEAYKSDCNSFGEDEVLIKEAIERTYDIAHNLIGWVEPDPTPKLPKISNLKEKTEIELLTEVCFQKLKEKKLENNETYVARLSFELETIKEKNVAGYFLTVREIVKVLSDKMLVGPARGSAAGSIVCYLAEITQIDPIKHNLVWERFYSRGRSDLPDIDLDFSHKEDAMAVLKEQFGTDNVLYVSNYNKLNLKSLLKDVSKLYGVPFDEVNMITAVMEDEAKPSIMNEINHDQKLYELTHDLCLKYSPTYKNYLDRYPELSKNIVQLYRENRSIGKHAAAVLVLEDPWKHMPVIYIKGEAQCPITEGITAQHLQAFGLIKIDVLGLNTLKIIKKCIELILEKSGVIQPSMGDVWRWYNEHIHPDVIDVKDQSVFDKVYKGKKWCSIFQFTQQKVKDFSDQAQLSSLEELSQATSIQRPGPLSAQVDVKYIKAKVYGENNIQKEHPIIQEVLGPNYGFILFQEDFLMLASKLAGFSIEEADKLRKLLMKPSHELRGEILEQRNKYRSMFIDGCVKKGMTKDRATTLWDVEIAGFVSYSFNRSHSISYSYISLQCAYLLTYFEEEWICSCLELDEDREAVLQDVSSLGYKIGKFDILKSNKSWKIEGRTCVPSLLSIKGFGDAAVDELLNARQTVVADILSGKEMVEPIDLFNGFFYEIETKQLKNGKIKQKKVWRWSKFNKRPLEALIKMEAFDSFGIVGANCIFKNYAHFHRTLIEHWADREKQTFDIVELAKRTDATPWSNAEIVEHQKDILGSYDKNLLISKEVLQTLGESDIGGLDCLSIQKQNLWFFLQKVELKKTKTNKKYYKLTIMDLFSANLTLNYFLNPPRNGWKINGIYIGCLYKNGGYINNSGYIELLV